MHGSIDVLLDQATRLLDDLRRLGDEPGSAERLEELLTDGYATALALEGARRRLRARAVALATRELELAARERELRELLEALRASGHEAVAQRLH